MGCKVVIGAEKDPVPEPAVVFELLVVGVEVVLDQQIPLLVIVAPPSLVIFPPLNAVV